MPHHPTLFIGLGGSGVSTVVHLKRLLKRFVTPEDLATYYRFRLLDTDDNEWQKLQADFDAEFRVDPHFVNRDEEWYSLGGFNPQLRWQEVKGSPKREEFRDILSWIDPQGAESFPNRIVAIGAEARRQLGRFCLAHHFSQVRTRLESAIQSLNGLRGDHNIQKYIQIVVVTSSCGGTGSSVFFDVLYLLAVLHQSIASAAPFLRPVIYSPKPFLRLAKSKNQPPELIARYHANACAFFLELQRAFSRSAAGNYNGAEDFVRPSWEDARHFPANWLPFEGALVVDAQREGPPSFIPFEHLYPTVAELLFYLALSGANDNVAQQWVNCNQNIPSASSGTFPRYLAAGFRALEYPSALVRQYLVDRAVTAIVERFRRYAPDSEGKLRDRAKQFVQDVVMAPIKKDAEYSFGSFAQKRYLEEGEGGAVSRLTAIDEFCTVNPKKPDELVVDPSAVTEQQLRESIDRLRREVGEMKASVRKDFGDYFGHPTRAGLESYYGRVRERLVREMEAVIERDGIGGWVGQLGPQEGGMVAHLEHEIAGRKEDAIRRLEESNARVTAMYGSVNGLERLKQDVLEEARRQGGLFARWTGRGQAELRSRLEAFAAKREDVFKESLNNVLLMCEIEALSFVGSRDPVVQPTEYFTVQDIGLSSLLRQLRDQGRRIREWLGAAADAAQKRLDTTIAAIGSHSRSLLVTYEPSLDQIMDADGNPGPMAERALRRLLSAVTGVEQLLLRCTESAPRGGWNWRSVRADPDSTSLDLVNMFLDGAARFVDSLMKSELTAVISRSIKERLDELPDDQVNRLRDLLGIEKVAAFSPLSDGARADRPKFRILVTASDGGRNSVAELLGYQQGDDAQMHLPDFSSPQRALAVKLYSMLYLEDDFPWFRELRGYYDKLLAYNPHLHRDGRVRQVQGSESRLRRAFALGLAWAVILRDDRWKKEPALARLFTSRLDNEPDAYLHESPLSLRRQMPHLLAVDLKESMLTHDGRIECRLEGVGFEKVAEAGQYGAAWVEFLKRPRALSNVEFFHRWCGGVEHDWQGGRATRGIEPVIQLKNEERAKFFVGQVADVLSRVRARREQLEQQAIKGDDDNSTLQVLGWVTNELCAEESGIQGALGGPSL